MRPAARAAPGGPVSTASAAGWRRDGMPARRRALVRVLLLVVWSFSVAALVLLDAPPAPTTVLIVGFWTRVPLFLTLWAAGLALLGITTGPEPRYATRWGWFWLVFAGGLGIVTLPLLATLGMRERIPQAARLGGWRAFLLSVLLAPALLTLLPCH